MTLSDRHGRAFEYCVTESILSELKMLYSKVKITTRAKDSQIKGKEHFEKLSEEERKQYKMSGKKIASWLVVNRFKQIEKVEEVELDRIPDTEGIEGDVTDIRIKFFSENGVIDVNISLKHQHEALKHPRLTRVPLWIGLDENTEEAKQYEIDYEDIWKTFFEKGKKLSPKAERFRELKAIKPSFIEDNLYKPLYFLVKTFLEKNITNSLKVQHMFDFMVGKFDFVKFIDHDGKIEIRDFSAITKPNSVKIEYKDGDYLYMQFDNGLRISGRLHTATEWLKESIKFDMQPVNLDSVVPKIII